MGNFARCLSPKYMFLSAEFIVLGRQSGSPRGKRASSPEDNPTYDIKSGVEGSSHASSKIIGTQHSDSI